MNYLCKMTLLSLASLVALSLAIVWPLISIWSVNTLFETTIDYTFKNWLACWVLILTFQGAINVRNEKRLTFRSNKD